MTVYHKWVSYNAFAVKFRKLCDRLGLNVSEEARLIVFNNMVNQPEMSLSDFSAAFYSSADLFDGARRQRVYNDRVSYRSVADRFEPCIRIVLPEGQSLGLFRQLLTGGSEVTLEDFSAALDEFTSCPSTPA